MMIYNVYDDNWLNITATIKRLSSDQKCESLQIKFYRFFIEYKLILFLRWYTKKEIASSFSLFAIYFYLFLFDIFCILFYIS